MFPYVEGTLEKVLTNQWKPAHVAIRTEDQHWICYGLMGLADGLATIHRPPKQEENLKVFAFHFDLKPSNILITSGGIFKITDFGQALLKAKPIDGATTVGAAHNVGDHRYAPPENTPSRAHIDSSSRFSTKLASIQAETRNARSNISHQINKGRSRHRSASTPPKEEERFSTGSAKYDIWSLACVLMETLMYLLEGPRGLESFRADRDGAFYALRSRDASSLPGHEQHKLKTCVEKRLWQVQRNLEPTFKIMIFKSITCELLWKMFSIQASKRPSANQVKAHLLYALQTSNNPDSEDILSLLRGAVIE